MEKIDLGNGVAMETVQETLARHALHAEHPTPNPLNPPCQGDLSLNSPLIRGARGVRNDEYWIFAQSLSQERRMLVFCTVSMARKKFVGGVDMLNWKTQYFCANHGPGWKITSFIGYLPTQWVGHCHNQHCCNLFERSNAWPDFAG